MERRYISPEMDIIEFDTNDVITTSGELGGEKPAGGKLPHRTEIGFFNLPHTAERKHNEKLVRFL